MHTLGLLFVTPDGIIFLADGNEILADGIFVSPDVIVGTKGNISKEKLKFIWFFVRFNKLSYAQE